MHARDEAEDHIVESWHCMACSHTYHVYTARLPRDSNGEACEAILPIYVNHTQLAVTA